MEDMNLQQQIVKEIQKQKKITVKKIDKISAIKSWSEKQQEYH